MEQEHCLVIMGIALTSPLQRVSGIFILMKYYLLQEFAVLVSIVEIVAL